MVHCSNYYNIKCVNITSVLQYLHQWELKQKKAIDIKKPKEDKANDKKYGNIVLHLKVVSVVRGVLLV